MLKRSFLLAAVALVLLLALPAGPAAACHKGTPHGNETTCYPFTAPQGTDSVSGRASSAVEDPSGIGVPAGAVVLVAGAGAAVLVLNRRRRARSLR